MRCHANNCSAQGRSLSAISPALANATSHDEIVPLVSFSLWGALSERIPKDTSLQPGPSPENLQADPQPTGVGHPGLAEFDLSRLNMTLGSSLPGKKQLVEVGLHGNPIFQDVAPMSWLY